MTGYVFLLTYERSYWDTASAEVQEETYAAHDAFHAFVRDKGTLVASAALADDDVATTVRHRDGEVVITDGPFTETTEMIGGYYEVDLPDLDTALAGAAMLPAQYSVEVRPTVQVGV